MATYELSPSYEVPVPYFRTMGFPAEVHFTTQSGSFCRGAWSNGEWRSFRVPTIPDETPSFILSDYRIEGYSE